MDYQCVTQPLHIRKGLFYHQLVSIYKMSNLENNNVIWLEDEVYVKTRVGILADLPGYGKTLSVLGLAARDEPSSDMDDSTRSLYKKVESGNELCRRVRLLSVDDLPTTLVITNPSLVGQWEKELAATTLKYEVVRTKRDVETLNCGGGGIVLCPSNFFNVFSLVYKDARFRRIVIDEPNTVKISGLNGLTAKFMWLVTATPFDLLGKTRSKYLNDILPDDFDIVGNIIIKNPDSFVKSSFEMPPTHHFYHDTTDLCPKVLKGIIPDCEYAMVTSGNVARFLAHRGIKRDSDTHYLLLLLQHLKSGTEMQTDNVVEALEQRMGHVSSLGCAICADRMVDPVATNCCNQVMCRGCVNAWTELTPACPVCRGSLSAQNTSSIAAGGASSLQLVRPVSRFQVLDQILERSREAKVLVYTHFEKTGQQLHAFLGSKYAWADLRGTRGHKEKVLEDYKTGSVNVLLLTSLVDSAGFNLENTTDIVMFDQPSEYVETQVIGRALRVGRTRDLHVHHIQ